HRILLLEHARGLDALADVEADFRLAQRFSGWLPQIHRRRETRHGFVAEHLVVLDANTAAQIRAAHHRRARLDERATVVARHRRATNRILEPVFAFPSRAA